LTFNNLKATLNKDLQDSDLLKPLTDSRARNTFTHALKYYHAFKILN